MKKCVYGLRDASSNWYLSIKEKLEELKVKCCKSDPALFVYHENNKFKVLFVHMLMILYIKEIYWIYWNLLLEQRMKKKFVYLRLNIQQYQNYSISVDQTSYINNNDCVEMDAKRKANKNDMLTDIETKKYRTLIGQLSWIAC